MAWLHDNGDEEELAFDDEEDGEKEGPWRKKPRK